MSAEQWTPGERLVGIVAQEINDGPAEELIKAATDDVLRDWAAKIRETGTAKGWGTWAADYIHPDAKFNVTGLPSTEDIVGQLRRLDRAAAFRAAADAIEREQAWEDRAARERFGGLDHEQELQGEAVRRKATFLRRLADEVEEEKDTSGGRQPTDGESTPDAEPLIVSRYDVAMEPAPEEEPVLTVGAIAEDGRPVALLFDPEARRKVAGWLAPDECAPAIAEMFAHATAFEVPWPGRWRDLLLKRSYAGGDRWMICDREGRRWDREDGFVYEAQNQDERTRTDTRFPLAEAWALAQQIAAGEPVARADASSVAQPDAPSCATGTTTGEGL